MLDKLRSDKKLRLLVGVMITSIIIEVWAAMSIFQSAMKEVIVLLIALGISSILIIEIRKIMNPRKRQRDKSKHIIVEEPRGYNH